MSTIVGIQRIDSLLKYVFCTSFAFTIQVFCALIIEWKLRLTFLLRYFLITRRQRKDAAAMFDEKTHYVDIVVACRIVQRSPGKIISRVLESIPLTGGRL